MLASVAYEASIGSHGFTAEQAFDPETYSKVVPHRSVDYVAKRLEEFKAEMRKKYDKDPMYGSVWHATIED